MQEKQTENAIDEAATQWVARLDATPNDAPLRAEHQAWLTADSRHRGAFLRAQAAWSNLDRLKILPSVDADADDRSEVESTLSRRRLILAGGGVAAIAASVAAITLLLPSRDKIVTPIGEIRRVPLNDGSLVAVNTNSMLNIDIKPDLRELVLDKGEAWFDVAKDSRRPFVVTAGSIRVRAVGTAFSVRRHDDGADVLVTEGVVETWSIDELAQRARVPAGSKVFVSDIAGPSRVVAASEQIDRTLAWRNGEIALDGQTLAAAADEFNRYNIRRLTIDPSLADKRLVGWFHTNEPDTFARAAAETLGATVVASADEIHLAPRTGP